MKNNKMTRGERRRLLLKKSSHSYHSFARPSDSSYYLKQSVANSTTVHNSLSKRMLAIILAVVFVLTVVPSAVFFTLRGHAGNITGLEPVTMNVRVNGADLDDTAIIDAGVISENVENAQLATAIPEECFFVKAVMVDSANGSETEIASVGTADSKVYYSLDEDTNTGTLLDTRTQKLVLVYAAKYHVTIEESEHGEIHTNAIEDDDHSLFVWGGESLRVQVTPHTDYKVNPVSYTMGGKNRTAKTTNGNAVISNVSGDIIVHDPIAAIDGYQIINTTNIKNPSVHGNGNLAETLGQDSYVIANDKYLGYKYEYALYKSSYPPEPIAPGTTDTFYLYSDSNTGGSEYILNMFRINGEEFPVENLTETVGSEIQKTLSDGTVVTVRMHGWNQGLFWLDNNPTASTDSGHEWDIGYNWYPNFSGLSIVSYTYNAKKKNNGDYDWEKKRTIYEIEVQNPHSDLNVEYNFKQKDSREMIIKGLRGIEETGASAEERGADRYLGFDLGSWSITIKDSMPGVSVETRNYTLQKSNVNIYPAYYREQYNLGWSTIPSSNLYLYRVKDGYNPYSVAKNVEAHYYNNNGTEVSTSQYGILASETAERPDDAIVTATKSAGDVATEALTEMGLDPNNALMRSFAEGLYSFNNYLRNWGGFDGVNSELKNSDVRTGRKHLDWSIGNSNYHNLLLTDIAAEEAADPNKKWYAVALLENEAYNQQMLMNADPYNYYLRLDLGEGGSLANASNRFDSAGVVLTEKTDKKHTVEDNNKYILLPAEMPSNSNPNVIFDGWRLIDSNGDAIKDDNNEEIVYHSLAQIPLSGKTLSYAFGKDEGSDREADQVIALEAIWTDIKHADVTTILVEAWHEVPSDYTAKEGEIVEEKTLNDVTKKYLLHYRTTEVQAANEETALLNQHEPTNEEYYVLDPASVVKSEPVQQDSIDVIPEANRFIVYYDFAYENVSITKNVFGNPKALKQGFPITITFTRNDDKSPVLTTAEAFSVMVFSNGEKNKANVTEEAITYEGTFKRSDVLTISGVPYGWTCTVSEEKGAIDPNTNIPDYQTTISSDPSSSGAEVDKNDGKTTWEGTIVENTDIDVTNKSDSYLNLDKKLTRNQDGTYDITLEAYANGDVLKDSSEVKVPTDYILILDQSGSMDTKDMPVNGYADLGTGGSTGWTISQDPNIEETNPQYFKPEDENRYYRVYRKWGPMYCHQNSVKKIADIVPRSYDKWFQENDNEVDLNGNNGYYYKDNNGDYYPVRMRVVGKFLKYAVYLSYIDKNGVTHGLNPRDFGLSRWDYGNLDYYTYRRGSATGIIVTNESIEHLKLYKKVMGYNELCYKNKEGVEYVLLGTEECVINNGTIVAGRSTESGSTTNVYYNDYKGIVETGLSGLKDHLWVPNNTESRVYALNEALNQFIDSVSSQYNEDGSLIENRVAMVGFSSPNDSSHPFNNTELLTGVEIKSGNYASNQGFSLDDPYQYHNGPQYNSETGKTSDLQYANDGDYSNALLDVASQKDQIKQAVNYVTAYGGTKPKYGFEMAEKIIDNRGETAMYRIGDSKKQVPRNVAVIFFTDGRPGNYRFSNQPEEANEVVDAAASVKTKATVYSIGVFGESDNNPLTYDINNETPVAEDEEITYLDGYAETYRNGSSSTYFYLFRHWLPNAIGYPATPDDTIQSYMEVVSSDYPDAKKFYQAPANGETYSQTIYSDAVRGTRAPGKTHYYTAGNIEDLEEAFTTISEDVVSTSPGAYDDTPMVLRDVINTSDFMPGPYDVESFTVNGKALNPSNNEVTWAKKDAQDGQDAEEDRKPFDATIKWSDDKTTLDVSGFNFKQNYIANSKPEDLDNELGATEASEGRKLVVKITGLVPKKDATGKLESNTADSGIYKMVESDDPEEPAKPIMQNAFDIPSMYRYRYNLLETGDRTDDTFDVVLNRDGDEGILAVYDGETRIAEMRDGNSYNWNNVSNGDAVYFETFNEQNKVTATVALDEANISDTLKNTDVYDYTIALEDSAGSRPEVLGELISDTKPENSTFHIRNNSKYRDVLITEETRGVENEADFSDPFQQFPIDFHYYKGETPFEGDIEATITRVADPDNKDTVILHFDRNGWSKGDVELADGDTVEFRVLEGYTLTASEDPDDIGNYEASYEDNDDDITDGSVVIKVDNQIKVINTLKSNPVVTGLDDVDSKINPFMIAAGTIALLGGAWIAYLIKRRQKSAEQ